MDKLKPIWEYEQTEDSDLRLEQIFKFLFEDERMTQEEGVEKC